MTTPTWDEKNKNAVLLTCVGCGKPFYFSVPRPEPRCAFCVREKMGESAAAV